MNLRHVNGATLHRTDAFAELVGIDQQTGGAVWLAYTSRPFDPARGDWLEADALEDDPDAVAVVAAACLVRPTHAGAA